MKKMRNMRLIALCTSAVLACAAGTSVAIDETINGPGGSPFTLTTGRVFHQPEGPISNFRTVGVPGTATVLYLWDEGGSPYYAISRDGGQTISGRVRETDYTILLRYAKFDPMNFTPGVNPALQTPAGSRLHLVQFWTVPLKEYHAQIEALGGEVVRFMSNHTNIIRMSDEATAQISQLPFVRWAGPYHPAYKLDDEIHSQLVTGDGAQGGPERYSIEVFLRGDAEQDTVREALLRMGVEAHFTTPLGYRMEATLTRQQLLAIAKMDEVNFIHPRPLEDPEDMNILRILSGANHIESSTGFTGQGVRGESFDSGFQIAHQDFNPTPIWRTASGTARHGTATYGIMFGDGTGSANARGLCPDSDQGFVSRYHVTTQFGGGITRHSLTQSAVDPAGNVRIVLQTSSVGPYRTRFYDTISAEVDDYLFLYDLLSTQSMSNAGGTPDVRPQAWAKNMVGVGGIRHQNTLSRADDVAAGSSGESTDGRIKPDLSNFYDSVLTTYSTSTTGYGQFSGTSSATPITAGTFGLLFQMWHEEVFPGHGGGASVFDSRPHMATAKAMMVNTAHHYPLAQGDLRRKRQGWGMADAGSLYDMRDKMMIIDEQDPILPLQTNTYNVDVPAGEPNLNVTMVYTDPMGTVGAARHRINDLSLRVTSPSGTVYWGNNGLLTSHFSSSGGSSNLVDTTENVFIQRPQAGAWTVEVIGDEIVQDSRPETPALDADYALVITGIDVSACLCACDWDPNPACNIFDFLAFQNGFVAGDPCACDYDPDPACDIFDFLAFQNQFVLGCP